MLINLNAGHTLSGEDVGARGINGLKEEVLTRELVNELDAEFKNRGHKTNKSIVDSAKTLNESLDKQVSLCNSVNADLNICIHFNKTLGGYGSEIYTHKGGNIPEADRVLKELNKLGFRNRGIKSLELALINRTKAKTIYIEVCFIDSEKDIAILNKYGAKGIAKAIVNGVLGQSEEYGSNSFIKLDGGGKLIDNKPSINLIIRDFSDDIEYIFGWVDSDGEASWAFSIDPLNENYKKLEKNCSNAISKRNGGNVFTPGANYKIRVQGLNKDKKLVTESNIVLKAPNIVEDLKENSKLYTVQVGAFREKNNAENLLEELKGRGFQAYIKQDDNY